MKEHRLPQELQHYLDRQLFHRVHPLCLVADAQERLTGASGDLDFYGLADLVEGERLDNVLPWLSGTAAGLVEPLVLEFLSMETRPGVAHTAHVHLVPLSAGLGIVLLDASDEQAQRRERQQAANELALLHRQREKLLAELEQSQVRLQESHRRLEEAGQLKSLFIGNMSHEFRTPLTSILGYLDLRHQGEMKPAYLDAMEGAARHLLSLVDNLLDQAKLENDELQLNPTETDVREIAGVIRQMFERTARQSGIGFTVEVSPRLPACLLLDGMRLRQILVNLTGNAFKFTQQGEIRVTLDWQDARLNVAVSDTGSGIPVAEQRRIFEPFRQAGQPAIRRHGAGLGLAITLALVERMGGRMQLESTPGKGSRFVFDIDAPESHRIPVTRARTTGRRHLLIVEDDPDIRALLGAYLEDSGYDLAFAADGGMALAALTASKPDLLLMDLHLPDMMGPQVVQAARDEGYEGPVIILSAAAGQAEQAQAAAVGVDAYLAKPIDPAVLLKTLSELG